MRKELKLYLLCYNLSEHIKEKHYSSLTEAGDKVVEGFHFSDKMSINDAQRLWTRNIQAQTADLGPHIESYSVGICWSYLVLRL